MSHKFSYRSEDIVLVNTEFARLLQVIGQYVEKKLAVAVGVDVSVCIVVEVVSKVGSVDEVAVLFRP
jgi:hypothetical protein